MAGCDWRRGRVPGCRMVAARRLLTPAFLSPGLPLPGRGDQTSENGQRPLNGEAIDRLNEVGRVLEQGVEGPGRWWSRLREWSAEKASSERQATVAGVRVFDGRKEAAR